MIRRNPPLPAAVIRVANRFALKRVPKWAEDSLEILWGAGYIDTAMRVFLELETPVILIGKKYRRYLGLYPAGSASSRTPLIIVSSTQVLHVSTRRGIPPWKVMMSVVAHELAHAWIDATGMISLEKSSIAHLFSQAQRMASQEVSPDGFLSLCHEAYAYHIQIALYKWLGILDPTMREMWLDQYIGQAGHAFRSVGIKDLDPFPVPDILLRRMGVVKGSGKRPY